MSKNSRKFLIVFLRMCKAGFGVVGAASVLSEVHPYSTITFLALAAAANEAIPYFDIKIENNDSPN